MKYPGWAFPWLIKLEGKRPVEPRWQERAGSPEWATSERRGELVDWAKAGRNIGLGVPPCLVVLDGDSLKSYAWICALDPDVPHQDSARGGHGIFRLPPGASLGNRTKAHIIDDIYVDVKAAGGQIAVEPSIHPSGMPYVWKTELPERIEEIPELPPFIAEILSRPEIQNEAPDKRLAEEFAEGERNERLYRLGRSLHAQGFDHGELRAVLATLNETRCTPSLDADEVERLARQCSAQADTPEFAERRPAAEDIDSILGSGDEGGGFAPLTATQFHIDALPESLVESLVYRQSLTTLNAPAKSGKGLWTLQLIMSVIAGEPFLSLRVVRSRVLLISLEMSAALLAQRMEAISKDTGLPVPEIGVDLEVIAPITGGIPPRCDLARAGGWTALRNAIVAKQPDLVVLDTLHNFTPGMIHEDRAEMQLLFDRLIRLAREQDVAFLVLDHTRKGEAGSDVAQSGFGSQAKGATANVIIELRRTAKTDGGRWSVDVASHFGGLDEPIYYERPRRDDRSFGAGCVLCSATKAHGLDPGKVHGLFLKHGGPDEAGNVHFRSMRTFIAALLEEKLATSNGTAEEMVRSVERDLCHEPGGATVGRPILLTEGSRNRKVYTWLGSQE